MLERTASLTQLPGVAEAGRVHDSAQRKLADAQRLQAAIAAARAEGRTEDLKRLEQLAAQMTPALQDLDREIQRAHNRMRREVFDFASAAVADEVKRLEDRKARRMKRSWRR
jgi:hypothetical protein